MKWCIVDQQKYPKNRVAREKQCPACGNRFECCAGGCWCDTVSLTEAARTRLLPYVDCLCPACLGRYASPKVH